MFCKIVLKFIYIKWQVFNVHNSSTFSSFLELDVGDSNGVLVVLSNACLYGVPGCMRCCGTHDTTYA